jgi:Flp pilus assembly protein TadD
MNIRLLAAIFALCGAAHAVDSEPPAAAARQDRVAKARQAIAGKDWDVAVRELQAAIRDNPQDADAHNLLGYSYRKRARPDLAKSLEHYGIALKINPDHKGAHEYIGEAYLMQGKPAEAEAHLARLEQICGGRGCEEYQDLARSIDAWKARR